MPLLHQEPRHFCQKQLLLPQNSLFLSFWLVSNPPCSLWCCWPRDSPLTPCCSAWRWPRCPRFPWAEVASGERHCAASLWREHRARAPSWRVSWGSWGPCTASCSRGFYRRRASVNTSKSWVIFRISPDILGTGYGPRKYNEQSSRQQQNVGASAAQDSVKTEIWKMWYMGCCWSTQTWLVIWCWLNFLFSVSGSKDS